MSFGTCRSCNARIWWAVTVLGKNMPMDPVPALYLVTPDFKGPLRICVPEQTSPDGPSRAKTVSAVCLKGGAVPEGIDPATLTETKGWTPHWATCPRTGLHKKRKGKA